MKKIMKFLLILLSGCFLFTSVSCINIGNENDTNNDPNNSPPIKNQLDYELNEEQTGWIIKGIGTCNDSDLIIPETHEDIKVVGIDEGAFQAVGMLTSVHISKNIKSIGEDAFLNCNRLAKITVDEENSWFSAQNDILYNKEKTKLVAAPKMVEGEIIIPGTLGVVENYSYGFLANISSFTLGEGITKIEDQAFSYSTSISYVVFPKSLTNIGTNIFTMCQALDAIYYKGTKADWSKVKKDSSLVIPVYYYSENEPSEEGNYWREVNEKPMMW